MLSVLSWAHVQGGNVWGALQNDQTSTGPPFLWYGETKRNTEIHFWESPKKKTDPNVGTFRLVCFGFPFPIGIHVYSPADRWVLGATVKHHECAWILQWVFRFRGCPFVALVKGSQQENRDPFFVSPQTKDTRQCLPRGASPHTSAFNITGGNLNFKKCDV